ncbi:MAG: lipoate--protein ligase family protein [Abditibacteriales bacterium]|nr:lipoate--protein ligase family protein [Abditibacteriales bacterium]MDW8366742.1 lipoate--protein ligase family protein [Abditibacteriales bacterium]
MRWRFLDTGLHNGAWNMAVDEAMLLAHAQGLTPPTLRFFRWQPPCVSLGYFQSADEVDWEECARRGYDVVRRPTGGRAILHDQELTYSVVIADKEIAGGSSVLASYAALSQGLILGLRALGIEAYMEGRKPQGRREAVAPGPFSPANCFAAAARCDLLAGGKKIVGSAQVRREGVILQHGAVPLRLNVEAWQAVLPGTTDLALLATDVNAAAPQTVSYDDLARALRHGFEAAFGVALQPAELTDWENAKAQDLVATKYTASTWTRREVSKKV